MKSVGASILSGIFVEDRSGNVDHEALMSLLRAAAVHCRLPFSAVGTSGEKGWSIIAHGEIRPTLVQLHSLMDAVQLTDSLFISDGAIGIPIRDRENQIQAAFCLVGRGIHVFTEEKISYFVGFKTQMEVIFENIQLRKRIREQENLIQMMGSNASPAADFSPSI